MITPAYASTATERVLPRLALDFTTASLDSRVTVTRALNTGTRVNSSGLIETINANLPRFDFDPITKVCKGLLIEESRTQTARASDLMSQWSRSATTASANVVASPSGAQDADLIYPSSSGNNRQVYIQSTTAPTSGSVAISVFAADAGLNWIIIYGFDSVTPLAWFDVANGVKGTVVAGWTSEIEPYENGFYRCSVVGTAVAGGYITFGVANADNSLAATASGTNGVYFWGAQVEAGAFKTSYISNPDITNGSSVTRNADVVSMTGTNLTDWYISGPGTIIVSTLLSALSTTAAQTTINLGVDGNNQIYLYANNTAGSRDAVIVTSGSGQGFNSISGANTTSYTKQGFAFATNSSAHVINGGTPVTDATVTLPSAANTLKIGSNLSNFNLLNGHVAKIMYWPQRLTNAELQAFTK
jgi:hypothetical protein